MLAPVDLKQCGKEETKARALTMLERVGLQDKINAYPHHYAEALCRVSRKTQARQVIRDYWGGMVENGADTYWELYNPENPDESPYGSPVVNSFCHAWSCTPAWFLRSGILEENA